MRNIIKNTKKIKKNYAYNKFCARWVRIISERVYEGAYSVHIHEIEGGGVEFSIGDWNPNAYIGYLEDTRCADGTYIGTYWQAYASRDLQECLDFMWRHLEDSDAR